VGKFGDLHVSKVSKFNYDLVMVLDFHIIIYVKNHVKSLPLFIMHVKSHENPWEAM
jgi:hypothetical protein